MCGFMQPKIDTKTAALPTKTETVSQEDTTATQLEQEKKRRGFSSTVATSGMGVTEAANVKKQQLGV